MMLVIVIMILTMIRLTLLIKHTHYLSIFFFFFFHANLSTLSIDYNSQKQTQNTKIPFLGQCSNHKNSHSNPKFFFFRFQIQTSLPQLKSYILQTNFSIVLPIILALINSKPYNKLSRNSNIKFGITAFCLHHSLFISLSRIHTCTHAQRRSHTRAHVHTYTDNECAHLLSDTNTFSPILVDPY